MDFIKENFINPDKLGITNPISQPRIKFIDLAKGVCIILVVMVHCDMPFEIPNFQALRMPLYFVLSGLFFRDYGGFINLTIKKCNKLIVPFLFFYILSYLIIFTRHYIILSDGFSPSRFWDPFFSRSLVNGPLWFLLCLFWCNILWYFIHKLPNYMTRIVAVLLLTIGGFILGHNGIRPPLYWASALVSLPFFTLGTIVGKANILYPNKSDRHLPLLIISVLGIAYFIFFIFDGPVIITVSAYCRG